MRYYRRHFPHSTVLPKMHFLEDHAVAFLKKWKVGFGLLGEQGAESIHQHFNQYKHVYCHIPDPVKRLKCMLRSHLLYTSPVTSSQRPKPKKRKITETGLVQCSVLCIIFFISTRLTWLTCVLEKMWTIQELEKVALKNLQHYLSSENCSTELASETDQRLVLGKLQLLGKLISCATSQNHVSALDHV